MNEESLDQASQELAGFAAIATAGLTNEATLRHELENALKLACEKLSIPWTSFTLDLTVSGPNMPVRFVDVAHGAILIEYERPSSFKGAEKSVLLHARAQVEEYAIRMHEQEGRPLSDYVLVVWDGAHISFGAFTGEHANWSPLTPFFTVPAKQLLLNLDKNGRPLVHPLLLSAIVGPESEIGALLQPALFDALLRLNGTNPETSTTKTKLLFTEWKRTFGQVVGTQSEQLRALLIRQSESQDRPYDKRIAEYLFALNTYIALMAKLVAALAMPNAARDITEARVPLRNRLTALENGSLFASQGIVNMLVGDFFSWYIDDPSWPEIEPALQAMLTRLSVVNFDVTRKDPATTRDLFKGLYQVFIPRELRHALGEVYTPDWLSAHAMDLVNWNIEDDLLDPTCGSGTFLLEAVKRRIEAAHDTNTRPTATDLLRGIHGIDLNPLAVLAARASLVVFLMPFKRETEVIRIPVYLADAINSATVDGNLYRYTLQTEIGVRDFAVPAEIVRDLRFHDIFARLRDLVNADLSATQIWDSVIGEYHLTFPDVDQAAAFQQTVSSLVGMHARGWDGIWCLILADRFAVAAIGKVSTIVGNPPWVKWSNLPPEYAAFIRPICLRLGVFSTDKWVGGIESDISTIITFESARKWLNIGGKLAFFITGTVFANESSEGFRRFDRVGCTVEQVEDYRLIAPFEGVTNHATLLILQHVGNGAKDAQTWPVPYSVYEKLIEDNRPVRSFRTGGDFRSRAACVRLTASPMPGTEAGPWLKGSLDQQREWRLIFDASAKAAYKARKGVTTDANGVFFLRAKRQVSVSEVAVENDPALGRREGIPRIQSTIESDHLFPLLRGRGITAFSAAIDPDYCILVPQRGMHGDSLLAQTAPKTYSFLRNFQEVLESRSSLRRFQKGQAWWSLWSTGAYTFSPFKVLWREMGGHAFAAAYIGSVTHPVLGQRIPVPDHKLYFVPVATEDEAAFITAVLNAPKVSDAISAYASQLSLGVSVVEYLQLPQYDSGNSVHAKIAVLSKEITNGEREWNPLSQLELDVLVDLALHDKSNSNEAPPQTVS